MEDELTFGSPTCMACQKVCDIVEYINTPLEMWCYCPECDIDTFHKPINGGSEYDE
jgi:hypothetical protein